MRSGNTGLHEERCAMTMPDRQRWKQLTPLLDELLDLEPSRRRSRLAELRASDATSADELATMLAAADRAEASNFLAGDAQGGSPSSSALIGQQIGAYVIEAPLGQGGTGSVWRARRADGRFEGAVAVKLLHLSLIGRIGALRFQREGAILARLTHPHIARLLDAGVTAAGQPYLVLELVEGERIDHHCNARRLTIEQRLVLFDDVLAAVAHAHSHLVIHRDIKPNNILVARDGSVKLLDFGIAKLLETEPDGSPVTADGQRALTPEYAAPEQLRGTSVTTATDIYALGVLLYRLLTGGHPTAPNAASSAEVLRATLNTDPLRLTAALTHPAAGDDEAPIRVAAERSTSLPRLRRQLRGDLENIVAQSLRKDPAQRFQTVAALAGDLRRYRANEPVSARADSLAYRAAKFMRRHRSAVAASLAIALAAAAGIAGTMTQADEAREQAVAARAAAARADAQAHIADRERASALRALTRAEASDEFMRFILSQSSSQPLTMSQLLARSEQTIARQFADDPGLQAYLQLVVADLYGELLDYGKAEALLQRARSAAERDGDAVLVAQIDCTAAGLTEAIGRGDRTQQLDDAIERLRKLPGTEKDAAVDCLNQRAIHHRHQGNAQGALADATEALARMGSPRPGRRAIAADLRATLGTAHMMLGSPADAITEYEHAIDELDRMGRGQTTAALTLRNNLGILLTRAGLWQRAAGVFRTALADADASDQVSRQLLEPNYARLLALLGRSAEARPLAARALASARASGNLRALGYTALAAASVSCGEDRLGLCSAQLGEARAAFSKLQPADRSGIGTVAFVAGGLALQRHAPELARRQLQQALAQFETLQEWNPTRTRSLTLLARTELELGDLDAANRHAAEAVASARSFAKDLPSSAWLGEALLAQALVDRSRGDEAGEKQSLDEALLQLHAAGGDDAPATKAARALSAVP